MQNIDQSNFLIFVKKLFLGAVKKNTDSNQFIAEMFENVSAESFISQQKHFSSCRRNYKFNGKVQAERITIEGDILSYSEDEIDGKVGVYIGESPFSGDLNYFEISIVSMASNGAISIGTSCFKYPLTKLPGWAQDSVGYHADDGRFQFYPFSTLGTYRYQEMLYQAQSHGIVFGPRCSVGDTMGCGIKIEKNMSVSDQGCLSVYFTKNGNEVGTVMVPVPEGGLYPCIGLAAYGDSVRLTSQSFICEEDTMSVDLGEEDWRRLCDIRVNNQVLEYTGRGKKLMDIGLAQARCPLNTTFHYFEIEIVDVGEHGYITIGLARKDYPQRRHPGWCPGSIAYHADDGRIFVGSSHKGEPFGPRCKQGDILGCGILFPRDYVCNDSGSCDYTEEFDSGTNKSFEAYDCDELFENLFDYPDSPVIDALFTPVKLQGVHNQSYLQHQEGFFLQSELLPKQEDQLDDAKIPIPIKNSYVQIYFTRNGKIIGKREVFVPNGGFFPSISMGSCNEKVRVDLKPLSG